MGLHCIAACLVPILLVTSFSVNRWTFSRTRPRCSPTCDVGEGALSSHLSQTRPAAFSDYLNWLAYGWNAWGMILSSASFNNIQGSGITIGSVDSGLWRGAGTCSWFTTMTLNTTDTTERLTNHYFLNKLQQLILFLSDDTQHFSICVVDSSGIELSWDYIANTMTHQCSYHK